MPLLKRKRFDLIPAPQCDITSKDNQVWYSPISREIFPDYSEYLKRTQLYKKPIWQCESTGKSNLTFKEALDSERAVKERFEDKIPEQLQKSVLLYAQFQTGRLDAVVETTFQYFMFRYVNGEVLNYTDDDNKTFSVKVLERIEIQDSEAKYRVQFLGQSEIKELSGDKLKRERFAFSKNLLKKFIKEYTTKDTYNGAPWIVSDDAATRFNINTTLPYDLQAEKDLRYAKSRKKRTEAAAAIAAIEKEKLNHAVPMEARKIEAILKYPMEDLNVPIYRRDPSGSGFIVDMTPNTNGAGSIAQNPTGGKPLHPRHDSTSTIPNDCFGSFLSVWSFLNVFSQPLLLSPFSVDDFERALLYDSRNSIITESNVALLNAVIKQRYRLKKESQGNGSMAREAAMSLYGLGYRVSRVSVTPLPHQHSLPTEDLIQYTSEDDDDEQVWKAHTTVKKRESTVERGCGSLEVEAVGHDWDQGTMDTADERIGWEDILIGFINQLAPLESLSDIDRILSHLVPSASSALEEREQAYISLSLSDKLKLFQLLIDIADESYVVKSYMDECQDQLTELRKSKIDLSRERKRLHAEQLDLQEKTNDQALDESSDSEDDSDSEDHALLKAQRQVNRHESRREAVRRLQLEREEREIKRIKLHNMQRQEARMKSQVMKKRNERRKRLKEDQRVLHKKEEQAERDMRKYNTHRIKPLGRDKFYNRYYYLDDVGGTMMHGSGRLYVQSPSDTDIMVLMERDSPESIDKSIASPCGHGGGVEFVSGLMIAQGLEKEAEFFNKRVARLKQGDTTKPEEWWYSYNEPEDIQKLLEWLNPKGIREFILKRELEKQLNNLTNGMKKRTADQSINNKQEVSRRTTRSKTVVNYPPGSWLSYVNKLADI